MKWTIGLPGGMNGPFYSIVAANGNVIAMRIPSKETAELIASLGNILDYDFETVTIAGRNIRRIINSDGIKDIPEGTSDYLVKSVILALFGDDYTIGLKTR